MLQFFLILSAVYSMGMAAPLPDLFSYSPAVGDGSGTEFSTASEGRITGIRVWENNYYYYISGFQLKYESNWTASVGANSGNQMEMILNDKEAIIQVSGKYYSGYIYELVFITNQWRFLKVGQCSGLSFNFYPTQKGNELRFLSGRQNGSGITSIGAHWATIRTAPGKA
ncbi:zymogen granule membrane protein 16-like [Carassius gibelio]|uniref:zymogen granule membrane protein 16-like n=1 Tax=Carassius gibelio TaxID=101364 RepID=UPI002277A828|nr:zymogen granule membrane protein 16-like [Carassius gibelio]